MSSTSRHGTSMRSIRSTTGRRETNNRQTTTRRINPLQHIVNERARRRAIEYLANHLERPRGGSRKKLNKKRRTRKA